MTKKIVDVKDLPLTRGQAVELVELVYQALDEVPQFRVAHVQQAKARFVRKLLEQPEVHVAPVHVDGGGQTWGDLKRQADAAHAERAFAHLGRDPL